MLKLKKHRDKRDVLGFRLPMLTHEEPELDVTDIVVMDPDNTFYMRMGSDAMRRFGIGVDHILVIDRSLKPVRGSVVVFFHEGNFYTREYLPEVSRILLKADSASDDLIIEKGEPWVCWGVVTVALQALLQPEHRVGRYVRVCAC